MSEDALLNLVMSAYLGEKCLYCEKEYVTIADMENAVWAGNHEKGRLACKECWDLNHPSNDTGADAHNAN